MGSRNQGNFNAMIIAGSLGVLVVGSLLIFWSKGYFSTRVDHRKDESRFTKFAEQADGQWEAQPPTQLANDVDRRIQRNLKQYNDPRFTQIAASFKQSQGRHQRGEIDHAAYQQQLLNLQQNLTSVEYDVDPDLRAKAARNGRDQQ